MIGKFSDGFFILSYIVHPVVGDDTKKSQFHCY